MNSWVSEQTAHILVADDEPQNLRILTELLSDTYAVHPFSDGASLLRYLDKGKPADLIMLDVIMPGASGFEVCEKIRSRSAYQDVPVVFLTSLDSVKDEARGLSLGGVDFIIKPFSPLVVLARLRNHVRLGLATRYIQTQNELLENTVQDRTRTLATILEASPIGLITIDGVGTVKTCNPAAGSILGSQSTDIVGSPLRGGLADHIAGDELQSLAAGKRIPGFERNLKRPDGSSVTVRCSASSLQDDKEGYKGAVIAIEDVSEQKLIEYQLHHAQKMEAIGRLTSGLAHDFNNLLTVVIGNLDLMDKVLPESSPVREFMSNALNGSLRSAELTRQLLAFSRKQVLQQRLVDVNRLVRSMITLLSRTLGDTVEVKLAEQNDLWPVLVDPSQLDTAVLNLASNARDAMPKGGTLTISTSRRTLTKDQTNGKCEIPAGDYVVIEVQDTGIGMPSEVADRIFEPFFTTKALDKGTGIGLAMVYGFVKQSGGAITVTSEVGSGTTICLYLPRATEIQAQDDVLPATLTKTAESGGKTILIVEDCIPIQMLARHQLTNLGYKVIVADSALHGLAVLENGVTVHVLFSDVLTPGGMNGIDLARTAKSRWPDLRILLTTGSLDEALRHEVNEIGLSILIKPYRQSDLEQKLNETIG
ncbi:MAG: response regulator [Rhodospirillaceae bacterium]